MGAGCSNEERILYKTNRAIDRNTEFGKAFLQRELDFSQLARNIEGCGSEAERILGRSLCISATDGRVILEHQDIAAGP